MDRSLEVTGLIKPFVDFLKIANNEIKNLLEIGVNEYLNNQTSKYYHTNTFLHRAEKVVFDKVYFPVTVSYNHLDTKFENIKDIFEEYKYITIIGSAGSGKSTLVKHLFLNSIRQNHKIPVLIELRHLNDNVESLFNLISKKF